MPGSEDIAARLLEETGRALTGGDEAAFRNCFLLPQAVTTNIGVKTLESADDLGETFGRVRWHFRGLRMTSMNRRVLSSMFLDCDTIVSVHETRLHRHDLALQHPFRVLSTLARAGGRWRIVDCNYAIRDSLRHNRALFGPGVAASIEHWR